MVIVQTGRHAAPKFFIYRELRVWLQHPCYTSSFMPEQIQLLLLPWLGQATANEPKNTSPKAAALS
ncbi:hypothetical protein DFAR_1260028 [Desulfarculales bacterium]